MSANSKIEWTDHTFNPWIGCTKVSPGCANCYAETQNNLRKWNPAGWGKGVPRHRTSEANWKLPLKWDNQSRLDMECAVIQDEYIAPAKVFCSSLADWLDDEVPIEWLADLLDLIRRTPSLDWLLLTKRPENFSTRIRAVWPRMSKARLSEKIGSEVEVFAQAWWQGSYPPNVWIGTTVEDQNRGDERIPQLLSIPAKVRFLSCEPLLGAVNLRCIGTYPQIDCLSGSNMSDECPALGKINWVICGGESGPKARPMHPDWARSLRDQCAAAGVPFFFKQWGKKSEGRLLDGREHNEFPMP